MIKFIKQELPFEKSLKQRLDFICKICKTKPIFINGNIIKIDKTNLAYIKPHRIINEYSPQQATGYLPKAMLFLLLKFQI